MMKTPRAWSIAALIGSLFLGGACAQTAMALRAVDLRSDKLASAPVLAAVPSGASLAVVSVEGGWAQVMYESAQGRMSGWVRAGGINLPAVASSVSGMASGRLAGGNNVLTLGVRSLPARVNRHALIIGISRYADPSTPELPGARIDRISATQMATAMQVPADNIDYLQDEQATGANIRAAIRNLTAKVQQGDRVFIHYSGHGTRFNDPAAGGCVEALLAYDGGHSGTITNREMTGLLQSITGKTDKLMVMYDACHSGGLVNVLPSTRTRGLVNANDEGALRPRFAAISEECSRPVNIKTRNLVVELSAKGAFAQDVIHVAAARDNEISFDDEQKGGLATQYMRDCMLRDAVDLDQSGAVSMDEIRQCAQEKINKRLLNDNNFKAHSIVLSGNPGFVPAWFARPATATGLSGQTTLASSAAAAKTLTGEQALQQIFGQRDAKRNVEVRLANPQLRIGQDALDMVVKSDRKGFVYVAMAGSDNQSLYMLFPNDLDQNNQIEAGQTLQLPRPNWRVKAGGPAGRDHLMVMVTDGPRDLGQLAGARAGPFVTSLNDADGRARLGALMGTSRMVTSQSCQNEATRQNNPLCSDAFGAAMFSVEEIK